MVENCHLLIRATSEHKQKQLQQQGLDGADVTRNWLNFGMAANHETRSYLHFSSLYIVQHVRCTAAGHV